MDNNEIKVIANNKHIEDSLPCNDHFDRADEMVYFHSHRPSIIFWGVGNEIGAESDETIDYIKKRLYISNRLIKGNLLTMF